METFSKIIGAMIITFTVSVGIYAASIRHERTLAHQVELERQREEIRIQRKAEREKEFAEHPGANSRMDRSVRWMDQFLTGGTKP